MQGVRQVIKVFSSEADVKRLPPHPSLSRGEQVDQMTKLVMASTADAWLINLPGMPRRHEIYSMEQQMQDEDNVRELVASITDAHEHDDMESLSFSLSSLSKERQGRADMDFSLSLVFTYLAFFRQSTDTGG
jgi:hypothetical protein